MWRKTFLGLIVALSLAAPSATMAAGKQGGGEKRGGRQRGGTAATKLGKTQYGGDPVPPAPAGNKGTNSVTKLGATQYQQGGPPAATAAAAATQSKTTGKTQLGKTQYGTTPPPSTRAGIGSALQTQSKPPNAPGATRVAATSGALTMSTQRATLSRTKLGNTQYATQSGPVATAVAASTQVRSSGGFEKYVPDIEGALPNLSSDRPALMMVWTDLSGSTRDPFAGQVGTPKMNAIADVVNRQLGDWVRRNTFGGKIRNRLDVMLQGYGAVNGSLFESSLKGRDIVSLQELADAPAGFVDMEDAQGKPLPNQPIWVAPRGGHSTAMRGSIARGRAAYASWGRRPKEGHLVVGIHVTDAGEGNGKNGGLDASRADIKAEVGALAKDVASAGGKLLMMNIHISEKGNAEGGILFPTAEDAANFDVTGRMLFEMSSEVPAELAEQLGTRPGARMMAYNANMEQLAHAFQAGSSVAVKP